MKGFLVFHGVLEKFRLGGTSGVLYSNLPVVTATAVTWNQAAWVSKKWDLASTQGQKLYNLLGSLLLYLTALMVDKFFLSIELKRLLFQFVWIFLLCQLIPLWRAWLFMRPFTWVQPTACPSLRIAASLSFLLHVREKDTEQQRYLWCSACRKPLGRSCPISCSPLSPPSSRWLSQPLIPCLQTIISCLGLKNTIEDMFVRKASLQKNFLIYWVEKCWTLQGQSTWHESPCLHLWAWPQRGRALCSCQSSQMTEFPGWII